MPILDWSKPELNDTIIRVPNDTDNMYYISTFGYRHKVLHNESNSIPWYFQDKNVIEWASTYMRRTRFSNLDKKILWKAYPELIKLGIEKNKLGFTSPVGHWLRTNPTLIRQSLEFLSSDSRFNAKELKYYLGAPQRGNYRELMQLWSLVVLANWMAKI
jgi:hypothetical protein